MLDRDRREEDVPAAAAAGADTLQYAEWLESLVQSEYPLDVSYLSETVAPLLPPDRQARLRSLCAAIRDEDYTPKEPKVVNAEIKWPIGHVFRHRLFGYLAITRGFDYRCEAGEQCMFSLSLSLSCPSLFCCRIGCASLECLLVNRGECLLTMHPASRYTCRDPSNASRYVTLRAAPTFLPRCKAARACFLRFSQARSLARWMPSSPPPKKGIIQG